MTSNRVWHDPVVEIFSSLITPGVCCSADAYDLANRRWYRLDVDTVVEDDEWLASTVSKHISAYYTANRQPPPWNTVKTTKTGSPVTFATEPDDQVGRLITESLSYGSGAGDKLPTTTFDQLNDLSYMSRAADRCTWQGKDCVFKRIEFSIDVRGITKEIRAREALIDAMQMGHLCKEQMDHVNQEMTRRFLVVPILAVVIAQGDPWEPGTVAGLLMPFAGRDLEIWAREQGEHAVPVRGKHLRELVRGVRELDKCGIQHGDIKYWNTVLQPATEEKSGEPEISIIDMGSTAPDYQGDAKALGDLLLWCLDHSATLKNDEAANSRVKAAVAALNHKDFDTALQALGRE